MIRGIRNVTDFVYEEYLANFNSEFDDGIETVYVRAKNANVSSSMVCVLAIEGVDVQHYLQYPSSMLFGHKNGNS